MSWSKVCEWEEVERWSADYPNWPLCATCRHRLYQYELSELSPQTERGVVFLHCPTCQKKNYLMKGPPGGPPFKVTDSF